MAGGRDYDRKGGGKFGGGRGFGGNKFGGRSERSEGHGYGRFEPRFDDRRSSGNRFEGRQDAPRFDDRRGGNFEPRHQEPRGHESRGHFGEGRGAARGNFGAPRSFDDRAPSRGPRAPFEAGRTPFDKPARPAGGKSFGSGFDAKKRTPKPRAPR